MSALLPIQRAVFARLNGNAGVTSKVAGRIFADVAPQGTQTPYVVIGEKTEVAANTLDRYGSSATLLLHVFSSANSVTEALEVLDAAEAALRAPLSLTAHTAARARREITTVTRDPDGFQHVAARVRFFTLEAA